MPSDQRLHRSDLCPKQVGADCPSELMLRSYLEWTPEIVYFKDAASRFLAVSKSKALRHGLTEPAALTGKSDFDFFSEEHAWTARRDELKIIETGESVLGKLEKLAWPDGHESWALSNKMPLRNADGTIVGTFGVSRDVTAVKAMEQALHKTQQELVEASRLAVMAELGNGVLHNIGNVITAACFTADGLVQGLREFEIDEMERSIAALAEPAANDEQGGTTPESKQRNALQDILLRLSKERTHLLELAEVMPNLLEHVRGIIQLQQNYSMVAGLLQACPPQNLVEDALRIAQASHTDAGITVVRDYRSTPAVMADRHRVLQILVNLLKNAQHAMAANAGSRRQITVHIAPDDAHYVTIQVADDGIGISREDLGRLFTYGFTTKTDGHGFGLHSSRLAAQAMGGSLAATSDGIGHGATFFLRLLRASTNGKHA